MTLYEIDAEIMEIIENAVDPETGEIIDELAMAGLGNLNEAREKKIENMLLMVKNLESDAEQLKAEKLAFDQRQRVALNKEPEVDKTALGKLLRGGTKIPGARLVERQNMQIK